MNPFPFLHFFNTIVYVYLAAYISIKNPKALVNRICVIIFLCIGTWSFSMVFIHNPHTSRKAAMLFSNIGALGWATFSSLFVWFTLAFTGKTKILKKIWFYIIVFGVPLFFIYKQWTNFLFVDFIKEYFGWKPLYSKSIWPHLLYLYYLTFMAVGFYISIDFMKKTRNPVLKKQAKIIFVAVLIALIFGTFTDTIFPLLNIQFIPNIADTFILIWAFGVVYAMAKYKFLAITPAAAAENIISTMFDSLILLDLEGDIAAVNKAAADLSGYEEEELKGRPAAVLFPGEDQKNDPAKKIIKKRHLKNEDFFLRTKDGKDIPVLFSSSILKDETGAPGGIVCIAKDITERKKLEEETFKSKKLEAIGILAGGIAHDFNNLLSVIMGNVALVRKDMLHEGKADRFLAKAEEVSLKAADLAEKFITFSRGGWLKKTEVPLTRLLKNMEKAGLPGGDGNILYDIDIPPDLMPIDGDEKQLKQVMQNLLFNAVEAIPGQRTGNISIQAENIFIKSGEDENKLLLKEGKYVKISIEDNGIGVPRGDIEKIFDPYFSTKENKVTQKGKGLGLTICYSIIKKHDGHIVFESRKGNGTTVTLYLPAFTT
jgi:PAS domain S-box-containing protein